MSLHFINIRCDECQELYAVRRPRYSGHIPAIVAAVRCPDCHPEALREVCAACRLPFAVIPIHGNEMCFSCFQRNRRMGGEVAVTSRELLLRFPHGQFPEGGRPSRYPGD